LCSQGLEVFFVLILSSGACFSSWSARRPDKLFTKPLIISKNPSDSLGRTLLHSGIAASRL
jgi:hypothetical protein